MRTCTYSIYTRIFGLTRKRGQADGDVENRVRVNPTLPPWRRATGSPLACLALCARVGRIGIYIYMHIYIDYICIYIIGGSRVHWKPAHV